MNPMVWPVIVPLVAGLVALCAPRGLAGTVRWFAVLVAAFAFAFCVSLYASPPGPDMMGATTLLRLDNLGSLVLLGVGFFGFFIALYSAGFFRPGELSESSFYGNVLLSIGAASGIVVSSNLILLAVFWGLLGIPLYLLINTARTEKANAAAKKTMLVLGATDSLLLLGIAAFVISAGGTLDMFGGPVKVATAPACLAAVCFIVAALAKAGAMPFHTWVPDASEAAPVPVVALLPASLDKLLGIYLFARVFHTLFEIPYTLRVICLLIGAATVVFAVMAAMVQHNLRRLLGCHAVSQVGYMVIGIATGTAIGVVGGLFHMLNNAIYKSCLFLAAGAAERKTGETELDRMGGLARAMPAAFLSAVVAAFARVLYFLEPMLV